MLRPVSIVTVVAPMDRNGNSRKAYIVIGWDEEKQISSTNVIRDFGEGKLGALSPLLIGNPWDLPSIALNISAGEFKRLFKGG